RGQAPRSSDSVGVPFGMKEGWFGFKWRRAQGEVIPKRIRHPRQPEHALGSCELTLGRVDIVVVVDADNAAESLVAEQHMKGRGCYHRQEKCDKIPSTSGRSYSRRQQHRHD